MLSCCFILNIPKLSTFHTFLQAKAVGILDLMTNGHNLMLPSIVAIRATSFLSLSILPSLRCVVSVLLGSFRIGSLSTTLRIYAL
jgi:hypothetical protein